MCSCFLERLGNASYETDAHLDFLRLCLPGIVGMLVAVGAGSPANALRPPAARIDDAFVTRHRLSFPDSGPERMQGVFGLESSVYGRLVWVVRPDPGTLPCAEWPCRTLLFHLRRQWPVPGKQVQEGAVVRNTKEV